MVTLLPLLVTVIVSRHCPVSGVRGRGANTGQLGGWSWSLLIIKFVQLSRAGDLLIMIRELRRRGGEGEGDTEVSGRAGRRFELEPSFLTLLG